MGALAKLDALARADDRYRLIAAAHLAYGQNQQGLEDRRHYLASVQRFLQAITDTLPGS